MIHKYNRIWWIKYGHRKLSWSMCFVCVLDIREIDGNHKQNIIWKTRLQLQTWKASGIDHHLTTFSHSTKYGFSVWTRSSRFWIDVTPHTIPMPSILYRHFVSENCSLNEGQWKTTFDCISIAYTGNIHRLQPFIQFSCRRICKWYLRYMKWELLGWLRVSI